MTTLLLGKNVMILRLGKYGGKQLSPTDLDIPIRMGEEARQSNITGWFAEVYKMAWRRKGSPIMHPLEELALVFIFCLKECPGSVHSNAVVFLLYPVIIETMASDHIEKQGGTGEIVCDEEFFDLGPGISGNPTASCPQLERRSWACVPKLCKTTVQISGRTDSIKTAV